MNVQNISFFAHFSYFILFKFKSFGVKVLSQSWRKNENFLLSNESGRFSFFFFWSKILLFWSNSHYKRVKSYSKRMKSYTYTYKKRNLILIQKVKIFSLFFQDWLNFQFFEVKFYSKKDLEIISNLQVFIYLHLSRSY